LFDFFGGFMRPANFDPVAGACEIVYSYRLAASADGSGAAAAAAGGRRLRRTVIPTCIALVQLGILSAIALNLWRIAAP
jgi:hypothetical protein